MSILEKNKGNEKSMDKGRLTHVIKEKGIQLGFDMIGVSAAVQLEEEARDLEEWLEKGLHGKMQYMENHFDKRIDPTKLVEGALSVISVIHNYYPATDYSTEYKGPKISKYAWGEDYHKVLKRKMYELFRYIQEQSEQEISGRVFVDSAPVMDKIWAKRSGLGWIGKHTNLITPRKGSYFFIGEIILNLELDYDGPIKDFCGTCTRCIDACPTDALTPYKIDASKCISYLTIELREEMPSSFVESSEGWIYGCDICQEVCPWNRFSKPQTGVFDVLEHAKLSVDEWEEMDEKTFKKLTKKTAMNRVKWNKMKDNLRVFRLWEKRKIDE